MSTALYETQFLKANAFVTRKTSNVTMVSPQVHARVKQIVQASGDRVNISSYIDNVLRDHLNSRKAEIDEFIERSRQEDAEYLGILP